ncbi:hypothetical protein D3C83_193550 [compost metagenome]
MRFGLLDADTDDRNPAGAVAPDRAAKAGVSLHGENLFGLLAGQDPGELNGEHCNRPWARHERSYEGLDCQVTGEDTC